MRYGLATSASKTRTNATAHPIVAIQSNAFSQRCGMRLRALCEEAHGRVEPRRAAAAVRFWTPSLR